MTKGTQCNNFKSKLFFQKINPQIGTFRSEKIVRKTYFLKRMRFSFDFNFTVAVAGGACPEQGKTLLRIVF